jgi:hypothetical protein
MADVVTNVVAYLTIGALFGWALVAWVRRRDPENRRGWHTQRQKWVVVLGTALIWPMVLLEFAGVALGLLIVWPIRRWARQHHRGRWAETSAPLEEPLSATDESSLQLLAELGDVQGRLDDLKRRLRELAARR